MGAHYHSNATDEIHHLRCRSTSEDDSTRVDSRTKKKQFDLDLFLLRSFAFRHVRPYVFCLRLLSQLYAFALRGHFSIRRPRQERLISERYAPTYSCLIGPIQNI